MSPELLRDLRYTAHNAIEEHARSWKEANERDPLEPDVDEVPLFFADANEIIEVLDHVDHLQGLVNDLLSQKKKLEKDLKQTRYLSVLWVKILDSYIPPKRKQEAMKACAVGIAKGMQQAGIKEYEADFEQLEQQVNGERPEHG